MKINVEFSVDRESLRRTLKKIEPKLRKGAEKGLDDTLDQGVSTARERIMERRNPFTSPHLKDRSSFRTNTLQESDKIGGVILNTLDYAAYVDKGVSGTQNARDTPFAYTDSKPPVQKLVPWVQKHLNAWDIDTDPDPFSDSDDSFSASEDEDEYNKDLSEYSLTFDHYKTRIESPEDEIARNVQISLSEDGDVETYIVDNISEIGLNLTGSDGEKFYEWDDSAEHIVGRQVKRSFYELSEGDKAVFSSDIHHEVDRDIYVEITEIETDEKGNISSVKGNDVFDAIYDGYTFHLTQREFIDTKKESYNEWGDGVDFAESLSYAPEGISKLDSQDLEDASELISKEVKDIDRVVIRDLDGDRYEADVIDNSGGDAREGDVFLDAGFKPDGSKVKIEYDDVQDIKDSNYDLVGVPDKLENYINLQEGDDILVDADWDRLKFFLDLEDKNLENKKVRAEITTPFDEDSPFRFRKEVSVFGLPDFNESVEITYDKFAGTKENNLGTWQAKDAKPGDIVSFDFNGEIQTGRYVGNVDLRDERLKNYLTGGIDVFVPSRNEVVRVADSKITKLEKKRNEITDITPIPDGADNPAKLPDSHVPYDPIGSDFDEGKVYIAWDFRRGQTVNVKKTDEWNQFIPATENYTPYYHVQEAGDDSPDNYAFPIRIIGAPDPDQDLESGAKKAAQYVENNFDFESELGRSNYRLKEQGTLDKVRDVIKDAPGINNSDWDSFTEKLNDWKQNSGPKPNRRKLATAIKIVSEKEGQVRGGELEPSDGDIRAANFFQELSELHLDALKKKTSLNDTDDDGRDKQVTNSDAYLYRGLQDHEVGPLSKEIFANPTADSFSIDRNIINNYSFQDKGGMGKGLKHERGFNREDEILGFADGFDDHRHQGENEVWVAGGDGEEFSKEDLYIGEGYGDNGWEDLSNVVNQSWFQTGDFDSASNEELRKTARLVKQMNRFGTVAEDTNAVFRIEEFGEALKDSTVDNSVIQERSTTDSVDEIIDRVTADNPNEFSFIDDYDQEAPVEAGSLREYGFKVGGTGSDMDVKELPPYDPDTDSKEGLAIQSDYSFGGMDTEFGVREMATHEFVNKYAPDSVPAHVGDKDNLNWVAKEVVDGEVVSKIPADSDLLDDPELEGKFFESAAYQILAGNNDAHSDNVFITEEGEVSFIDLDHSAGDLSNPNPFGKSWYDNSLDRTLGELAETAQQMGISGTKSEIRQRLLDQAELKAQGIKNTEPKSLWVPNSVKDYTQHDDVDATANIEANIELFADGNWNQYL